MSKKKNNNRDRSSEELAAIKRYYAKKVAAKKKKQDKPPAARTATGKVPQGRTLKTHDNYLRGNTGSAKERPVVVIEADQENNLAVVPLSSRNGKNRSRLKNYQQGQSYFKHYIEIEDDEGNPIRINEKFNENHPNMDVSGEDVETIRETVFNHCAPMQANRKKMDRFRGNKKPRD